MNNSFANEENRKPPLVSVIVPVYNVEKYLDECISSVVNQTWPHLEILLIDDGSTDSSGIICDAWKEKDPRIIVFHRENSGVSATRNYGIIKSRGSYIFYLDADDFIDSRTIEDLLQSIQNTGADLGAGGFVVFYDESDKKYINSLPEKVTISRDEFTQGMFSWKNQYACGKLYPRTLLGLETNEAVLFREDLCFSEDIEWLARILVRTECISCVSAPLYYYRIGRSGSATTDIHKVYSETHLTSVLHAYDLAISTFTDAKIKPPIEFYHRRIYYCAEAEKTLRKETRKTNRYFKIAVRETFRGIRAARNKQDMKEVLHYAKVYMKARFGKNY